MSGKTMLSRWKNMHPDEQFLGKYIDLYENVTDDVYLTRTERFESWYENPIDLPGRYYLQAVNLLFRENRLARGEFVALGRQVSLKRVRCPAYLIAGDADDITTPEQVFSARHLLGTASELIEQELVPGGHIGLFMGTRTLKESWPGIARWLCRQA